MEISVQEVVESYNAYLVNLPKGCQFIADRLREDQISEALVSVKDFVDGVVWMSEAERLLKENNLAVDFNLEKANEFLEEINEGLEIQDYNLVADIFEYELVDYFNNLQPIELKQ